MKLVYRFLSKLKRKPNYRPYVIIWMQKVVISISLVFAKLCFPRIRNSFIGEQLREVLVKVIINILSCFANKLILLQRADFGSDGRSMKQTK